MRSHVSGPSALVLSALVLAGCYHYVPSGGSPIPRGTPIRVRLSSPRTFELPTVTVRNIAEVSAEMVGEEEGEVVLSARWLATVTGAGYDGGYWTFRIARSDMSALEIRKVSRWRTAAVLAGGFLATYFGFRSFAGSDPGGGKPGHGTATR